jgi:tRNA(Ile2) C34 agmatinyltransferase TiaS
MADDLTAQEKARIAKANAFMEYHSKRCPVCRSPRATSSGGFGEPVYHRCLDCKEVFADADALPSLAREEHELLAELGGGE